MRIYHTLYYYTFMKCKPVICVENKKKWISIFWPIRTLVSSCLRSKPVWVLRARDSPCPLLAPVWKTSKEFLLSNVLVAGPAATTPTPIATGWLLWILARCSGISPKRLLWELKSRNICLMTSACFSETTDGSRHFLYLTCACVLFLSKPSPQILTEDDPSVISRCQVCMKKQTCNQTSWTSDAFDPNNDRSWNLLFLNLDYIRK